MDERDENPYLYEYDSVIRSLELIAIGWQTRAEAAEKRVAELEAQLAIAVQYEITHKIRMGDYEEVLNPSNSTALADSREE